MLTLGPIENTNGFMLTACKLEVNTLTIDASITFNQLSRFY